MKKKVLKYWCEICKITKPIEVSNKNWKKHKHTNLTVKKMEKLYKAVAEDQAMQIETYIRLSLKPKPKWLPNIIYSWILQKLLILERLYP